MADALDGSEPRAEISPQKSGRVAGRLDKKRGCDEASASSEDSTERSGAPKQRSEAAHHVLRS